MLAKEKQYDLVIIGSGLSGQAAAAEAASKGLKTLVIEKGRTTGGSGNYVEGVFAIGSKMQKNQGIEISGVDLLHDEQQFSHFEADTQIWKDYINESANNVEWLEKLGVKFKGVATLGAGLNTWHLFEGLGNHAIHDAMQPYSKKRGVEFITSSAVTELLQDQKRKITGVFVEDFASKKIQKIEAKAVILATGGYLNNREMLTKYFNSNSNRIVPMNSGKSDGTGLRLAWEAGAKKFGLGMAMMFGGQIKEDSVPAFKFWKTDIGIASCEMAPLWVNEVGNRFVDESVFRIWAHAGNAIIRQEKVYAILDQATINEFAENKLPRSLKPLSERTRLDQLKGMIKEAEANNLSFLTKADTVGDLAKKLDLPELEATIKLYNELVASGEDKDFEKPANYLYSVKKGPFYAFELGVGAYCTMGGLRVNRKNEVLNDQGRKIDNLYAIGSDASAVLVGDTYGVNVPGSEAGYCIYSGRVAVKEIVSQK
ncbi:FAD-binding protein [uncultured Lactobacillus sp.]|uniref:FAD-dependent oxidoreductase n=1 Tax=uncultured Lactobacillus sp. TaxID=153152 RepID=UPI0025EE3886|nr:FAD-binding protein [uncultured Lactobacillus sp.]